MCSLNPALASAFGYSGQINLNALAERFDVQIYTPRYSRSENAGRRISRSIAAKANPPKFFSFGIHADGSREASREIVARTRQSIVYL